MTILSTFLLLITFFFIGPITYTHSSFFNKKTEKKNTKQMRIEHSVQKKVLVLGERKKQKKNRSKYYFGISWGRVWSPGFWESNRAK